MTGDRETVAHPRSLDLTKCPTSAAEFAGWHRKNGLRHVAILVADGNQTERTWSHGLIDDCVDNVKNSSSARTARSALTPSKTRTWSRWALRVTSACHPGRQEGIGCGLPLFERSMAQRHDGPSHWHPVSNGLACDEPARLGHRRRTARESPRAACHP